MRSRRSDVACLAAACFTQASACGQSEDVESHLGEVVDLGACEPRAVEAPHGVDSAELPCEVVHRNPEDPVDLDGDSYRAEFDADDEDPSVHPEASDYPCDGIDQDGDGRDPCSPDLDGDGIRAVDDCDDLDPAIGPLASETRCNGVDENCDGVDDCDRDGDGTLDAHDPDPEDPNVFPPAGIVSLVEDDR